MGIPLMGEHCYSFLGADIFLSMKNELNCNFGMS